VEGPVSFPTVRRVLLTLSTFALTFLLLAPTALAKNNGGQGLYGETNDKVVTNAGFLIIAFFPLFILAMSLLQWRLEKRKYARADAAKRRAGSAEWRGGW
jgi:hypothetical protein